MHARTSQRRFFYHASSIIGDGDGGDHFGLHPYSDEELLNELLDNSVDVMLMSSDPHPPSFEILTPRDYLLSEPSVNSHTLPTNFLLSLSYKPLNNTFLSLFSLLSRSTQPQNQPNRTNGSDTVASSPQIHSEFMLSHSATVMHSDSYYDLWTDFSAASPLRYTLNLIVMNGRVGMCMNEDYHPPMETVRLWRDLKTTDSLEMKFSPYLSSISSMVCCLIIRLDLSLLFCRESSVA